MPTSGTIDRLTAYGNLLKAAGFTVWLTTSGTRGFLTYERDGHYGHLQYSDFEGWQHDMPLVPSKEYGSSMFIGEPVADVWSVAAAEQAARATNHNPIVGTRPNAGARTWLSRDAIKL
jgi:hypothetical protein